MKIHLTPSGFEVDLMRRNEHRQNNRIIGLLNYNPLSQSVSVRYVCKPRVCRCSMVGRDGLGQWVIRLNFSPEHYSKLIRDKRISHGAFRLWHLFRDMTGNNPNCWPSLKTICREISCGRAALLGWIQELHSAGHLTIEKGNKRKSNRYFLSGSTQNLTGSKQIPARGSKQGHEFNSVELNSKNRRISPVERISLERERDELRDEKRRIRANCAQDATGTRFYSVQEESRLEYIKTRLPKLEAVLLIPL